MQITEIKIYSDISGLHIATLTKTDTWKLIKCQDKVFQGDMEKIVKAQKTLEDYLDKDGDFKLKEIGTMI